MSATANKLASNTYDLTNIDKIQDRIHRILAKKWVFIFYFYPSNLNLFNQKFEHIK